ncbi:hypothetical protein [Pseudorhodoplanes sinuspersici]|uniref:hypothetical protein n=1 Tax=Pseudorhodoplanes sinuspersici TaxID=1235591 RepID=UPI0011C4A515|nr:hypothetical protein [Pseudorhodoplanes sinuspersici]
MIFFRTRNDKRLFFWNTPVNIPDIKTIDSGRDGRFRYLATGDDRAISNSNLPWLAEIDGENVARLFRDVRNSAIEPILIICERQKAFSYLHQPLAFLMARARIVCLIDTLHRPPAKVGCDHRYLH